MTTTGVLGGSEAGDAASTARRSGRPRSAEADAAILDAATEEFVDHGLDGLSVDEVAARAGVSKATIYRRYSSKLELVIAAAQHCCRQRPPIVETGELDRDLRSLGRVLVDMLHASIVGRAIPRMVGDSAGQEVLGDARRAFIAERREQPIALVERAIARGDLAPGTDPRVVVDMLSGPVFYRFLLSGEPCDDAYVDEVVDAVLRAFRPA